MSKTRAQLDAEIREALRGAHGGIKASAKGSGGLTYRELGADGQPWPSWVLDLKHASGVYVIRDRATKKPLYVGSSLGKLYDTITRHFQVWSRQKTFWRPTYSKGGKRHDPGTTYHRSGCDLAVRITSPGDHLVMETKLIHKLQPRDNLVENPDGLEEAPF